MVVFFFELTEILLELSLVCAYLSVDGTLLTTLRGGGGKPLGPTPDKSSIGNIISDYCSTAGANESEQY